MTAEMSTAEVLWGYTQGIFPMADERGEVSYYTCDPRAIIIPGAFHLPRTLRQVYRQGRFELAVNRDFEGVLAACADRAEGTWISEEISRVYVELHEMGYAHSVEAYQDGELVGGLYGVSLSGVFFGDSMFHRVTDASKVALVHLVERMVKRGMTLLDVQFMTEHLRQFGTVEIPHDEYLKLLDSALAAKVRFA